MGTPKPENPQTRTRRDRTPSDWSDTRRAMKLAEAASISRNAIWSRSMSCCSAAPATWGTSRGGGVVSDDVAQENVARTPRSRRRRCPRRAPARRSRASRRWRRRRPSPPARRLANAAAMVVMTFQFTLARAAFWVRHPVASITPDASNAATKRSSTPATKTTIITSAVPHAGRSLSNCGGAEFSISDTSANAGSDLYSLRNELPVSSSRASRLAGRCRRFSPGSARRPLHGDDHRVVARADRVPNLLPLERRSDGHHRLHQPPLRLVQLQLIHLLVVHRGDARDGADYHARGVAGEPKDVAAAEDVPGPGAATASVSSPVCTAVRNRPGSPRRPAALSVLPSTAPPMTRIGHVKSVIARISAAPSRRAPPGRVGRRRAAGVPAGPRTGSPAPSASPDESFDAPFTPTFVPAESSDLSSAPPPAMPSVLAMEETLETRAGAGRRRRVRREERGGGERRLRARGDPPARGSEGVVRVLVVGGFFFRPRRPPRPRGLGSRAASPFLELQQRALVQAVEHEDVARLEHDGRASPRSPPSVLPAAFHRDDRRLVPLNPTSIAVCPMSGRADANLENLVALQKRTNAHGRVPRAQHLVSASRAPPTRARKSRRRRRRRRSAPSAARS